ncbi:MAG: DNA adenine methylase [Vicinamibacterales bacterium]
MRPLLKWAGGKRQLLPVLEQYYPETFGRYLEPFVGSGAVFFHLASNGVLDSRTVILSDVNTDLIGCYSVVRDRTEAVIKGLQSLEREHRRHGDECYYDVRDNRFNPSRATLMAESGGDGKLAATRYSPELAAMLIFLNRTGFNGLFRLNRLGEFNVPAGRYRDPRICDPDHIRAVAAVLRRPGVAIEHRGFETALRDAGAGDFVYCDPPYAPLSRTSSFANYTAAGFASPDQQRLMNAVIRACRRGARVVVSNSSAPEIETAYRTRAARQARIAVHRVPARRAINSRATSRGPVDELIITNVPAALASVRPRMVKAPGPRPKTDPVEARRPVAIR